MSRRLVISVAVSFACLMVGACVPLPSIGVDGPYTGRVVELETGEPIGGVVVATYWGLLYQKGSKYCYKETITDKNGEFEIPGVICIAAFTPSKLHPPHVVIFKPGYIGYPPIKTKKSLYTGIKFDKDHRHNVINLDKAITLSERSQTLKEVTSFLPYTFIGRDEPDDVIFERELPHLFKLVKQEGEYLRNEWKQIRKERFKMEQVVPPISHRFHSRLNR
ncbi:conserved hypothetical protein, membrane [Candidatus Magnetobacterium bavaricum]|uniref:Lipoprotein n=1 Tax=Candidatus Magnetobacterium bavaricum TaxID=29290 RepID=A0A0F3GQY4_9BACT|nr:conserved hypothetical protein, membrane [Candidatus Magnetobacterium bavaricum]